MVSWKQNWLKVKYKIHVDLHILPVIGCCSFDIIFIVKFLTEWCQSVTIYITIQLLQIQNLFPPKSHYTYQLQGVNIFLILSSITAIRNTVSNNGCRNLEFCCPIRSLCISCIVQWAQKSILGFVIEENKLYLYNTNKIQLYILLMK
jgi:hypothetical protein